jgi:CBS domain-containing protein
MSQLTANGLMDKFVTTLSPETDIHTAMETLLKHKLSGAPVVDSNKSLVGILSEKDCLKVVMASALERLPEGKVRDYMTTDVVTLSPGSTIYDIVNYFLKTPFRRLPVVEEGAKLVGMVSRTSTVKAIASMRDNPELYGTPDLSVDDEGTGVDSAMRRARGQASSRRPR